MSNYVGPEIPNNGLICMLDAANIKSYNPAENLLLYSEQFDNAIWSKNNISITENTGTAPDGTLSADTMTGLAGTSVKYTYQQYTTTTTGAYTTSVWLQYISEQFVVVRMNDNTGSNGSRVIVDLVNGTLGTISTDGTATSAAATIQNYGNGWYYVTLTCAFTSALTHIQGASVFLTGYTTTASTGSVRLWGAQFNIGPYARPYILTTTTARAASTTWTDLTGSGYNATLFNTYFVPTDGGGAFETRGIVGSYILQSTLNLAATNYTIITATRYAAASPRGRMFNGRSNNWLLGNWGGTTQNYYAEGWVSAVGAGTADTNWRIMAGTGQIAADAYSVYVNGTNTVLNSTAGSAGPNGFVIGMTGYDLSTELTLGRCSFVLAYNRVLTSLEVSQVFQAYRGRFGI
jgi:hypothetical protein